MENTYKFSVAKPAVLTEIFTVTGEHGNETSGSIKCWEVLE
jgi:hypothetical protein